MAVTAASGIGWSTMAPLLGSTQKFRGGSVNHFKWLRLLDRELLGTTPPKNRFLLSHSWGAPQGPVQSGVSAISAISAPPVSIDERRATANFWAPFHPEIRILPAMPAHTAGNSVRSFAVSPMGCVHLRVPRAWIGTSGVFCAPFEKKFAAVPDRVRSGSNRAPRPGPRLCGCCGRL